MNIPDKRASYWRRVQVAKWSPTMAERFEAKVDRGDGCDVWTGSHDARGYGEIFAGWDAAGKQVRLKAHVAALHLQGIEVPNGLVADHTCNNPPCVTIEHLRVVSQLRLTREHSRLVAL